MNDVSFTHLFTYGSWRDPRTLSRRGISTVSSNSATLQGFSLDLAGVPGDAARLLLTVRPGDGAVSGDVHEIADGDRQKLLEQAHGAFAPVAVEVTTDLGKSVRGMVFVAPPASSDPASVAVLAELAIHKIRLGEPLDADVAYLLGGMPYIDRLRALARSDDQDVILRLIGDDDSWSNRYLGTNLARPILDPSITAEVHRRYRTESHFHTRLAMVYLMLHAIRRDIPCGAGLAEVPDWLQDLESHRAEFLTCIDQFYSRHPGGTVSALVERFEDDQFSGARALYLLSLALFAEQGRPVTAPDSLSRATRRNDPLLGRLATRLQNALA